MNPDWNLPPQEIERRSFAIIEREVGDHPWDPEAWRVVRRMIHTTGEVDLARKVYLHPQAVARGRQALRAGRPVFTDTRMAQAGISIRRLAPLGVKVICLAGDPRVAELARRRGTTRAVAAVDLALERLEDAVCAIGNAPTALLRLLEHIAAGRVRPALVIGLPVGFVNAAESKQALVDSGWPCITLPGRRGGSALAASAVNALAELACQEADHV